MKVWRRLFSVVLAIVLISLCGITAYARNGDVAGSYYYTDIKTLFYFSPITSYNIGGKTVIDAEALNWHFGFEVYWHSDMRTLDIIDTGGMHNSYQAMNGELCKNQSDMPGKIAGHYYKSDIVTIFNGKIITSYNIGGRTCVVAEELKNCGYNVTWDSDKRTLTIIKPPDFYVIPTDYGTIKTIYNDEQVMGPMALALCHRGILLRDKDGVESELAIPSNSVISGYGYSFVRLSDVHSALNASCSLQETLTTEHMTESFNGFSYDMTEYKYGFKLSFDPSTVQSVVPAKSDYAEETMSEDLKYYTISDISININGEETPFVIQVFDGDVYIPTAMVGKMLGYSFAR